MQLNIEPNVYEFKSSPEFQKEFERCFKGKTAYTADNPSMFDFLANGRLKPSVITGYTTKGFTTDNSSIPWKYVFLVEKQVV